MTALLGVIAFVVLLLFAIGFHEFGHFITARWAGIKIRQFFIGFGPTLWSIRRGRPERVLVDTRGRTVERHLVDEADDPSAVREVERAETEYGIKLLPAGGYVRIVGMSPFEEVAPEDYGRSFRAAPPLKRAIVLAAGSVTHYVTAFIVLLVIFTLIGIPDPDRPTLGVQSVFTELEDGSPAPAFAAGIRPGDTIVGINGRPVSSWDEVRDAIRNAPGVPVAMSITSGGGATRSVYVTPARITDEGKDVGVVGVVPVFETERVNPIVGAGRSVSVLREFTTLFFTATPRAFTPSNLGLVPGDDPGDDRPLSIYGAGRIAAQAAGEGLAIFLVIYVQINVFIGLFNLLPLPPLDGGHLLLLALERLRGKPVSQRALSRVMAAGFALLALVGLSLLAQDIFSPVQSPFGQ